MGGEFDRMYLDQAKYSNTGKYMYRYVFSWFMVIFQGQYFAFARE